MSLFDNRREQMVAQFHEQCDQDVNVCLKGASSAVIDLRLQLLREELIELDDAVYLYEQAATPQRLADVLKELADLQYVLSGFAVTFGLPIEEAFKRVHMSNLSKVSPLVKDGDGKVLKGPNYAPPFMLDLADDYLITHTQPKEAA